MKTDYFDLAVTLARDVWCSAGFHVCKQEMVGDVVTFTALTEWGRHTLPYVATVLARDMESTGTARVNGRLVGGNPQGPGSDCHAAPTDCEPWLVSTTLRIDYFVDSGECDMNGAPLSRIERAVVAALVSAIVKELRLETQPVRKPAA